MVIELPQLGSFFFGTNLFINILINATINMYYKKFKLSNTIHHKYKVENVLQTLFISKIE